VTFNALRKSVFIVGTRGVEGPAGYIQALLDEGVDLKRAAAAAPQVDGGFSLLTLAWVLRDLNVKSLAVNSGFTDEEADRLDVFLKELIRKLLELAYPDSDA